MNLTLLPRLMQNQKEILTDIAQHALHKISLYRLFQCAVVIWDEYNRMVEQSFGNILDRGGSIPLFAWSNKEESRKVLSGWCPRCLAHLSPTVYKLDLQWKIQQDATVYQIFFIISYFKWSSACLGGHTAHHQETKTAQAASGFA